MVVLLDTIPHIFVFKFFYISAADILKKADDEIILCEYNVTTFSFFSPKTILTTIFAYDTCFSKVLFLERTNILKSKVLTLWDKYH